MIKNLRLVVHCHYWLTYHHQEDLKQLQRSIQMHLTLMIWKTMITIVTMVISILRYKTNLTISNKKIRQASKLRLPLGNRRMTGMQMKQKKTYRVIIITTTITKDNIWQKVEEQGLALLFHSRWVQIQVWIRQLQMNSIILNVLNFDINNSLLPCNIDSKFVIVNLN